MNYSHISLLVFMLLAIALSFHDAHDPFLWILEALPVLLGLTLLIATYRMYVFTDFTYGLIAFSFVLMLIGAHYTYSEVPLFNWLKDELGHSRNHFDRVGHFVQGVVPAIILRELLIRQGVLQLGKSMYIVIIFSCLGFSALYEIAEMTAAYIVEGGKTIDSFLGLQGDVWDTQKDMVLAGLGAMTALLMLNKTHDRALASLKERHT